MLTGMGELTQSVKSPMPICNRFTSRSVLWRFATALVVSGATLFCIVALPNFVFAFDGTQYYASVTSEGIVTFDGIPYPLGGETGGLLLFKDAPTTAEGGNQICSCGGLYNTGTTTRDIASYGATYGDGDYYYAITNGSYAYQNAWIKLTRASSTWSEPIQVNGVTQIEPDEITYSNNPIPFTGTYTNDGTFDQLKLEIFSIGKNMVIPDDSSPYLLESITVINEPYSISKILPYNGSYTVKARLYDSSTGSTSAWSNELEFALGTTTIAIAPPIEEVCSSILDVGCNLKNAFVWLFYPSEASLDKFGSITLANTFPFSYAYDVTEVIETLQTADNGKELGITIETGIGDITLISQSMLEAVPLSTTIRMFVGWVIWFMLIMTLYHRVIRSHDNVTTT